MLVVTCKQCAVSVIVTDGQDVHEALQCGCCDGDHHHGNAGSQCDRQHAGPCWQGPASGPRPDGCAVCRPVLVQVGVAMTLAGG